MTGSYGWRRAGGVPWTAGAERRLVDGEPKLASRPPFRTGRAPKGRGGLEELTRGLGREVEARAEEIDGEGRSSGSVPWCSGAAHEGNRGEEVRGEAGLWGALIRWRGKWRGAERRWLGGRH
jgi:hypothetical protein